MIRIGKRMVFSVPAEVKPVAGVPDGARVRMRFRGGCYALVFVRTADGITEHGIDVLEDESWRLTPPITMNKRK